MKKNIFLTSLLLLVYSQTTLAGLQQVTAISTPTDEGQKVTLAALQYDAPLIASELKASDFSIEGRKIMGIYTTDKVGGSLKLEQTQPSNKGASHMGTWQVAYNIPAIRHWLLNQSK